LACPRRPISGWPLCPTFFFEGAAACPTISLSLGQCRPGAVPRPCHQRCRDSATIDDFSPSQAARVRPFHPVLTNAQRGQLDALLVVAPSARMTTMAALRQPPAGLHRPPSWRWPERLQTIRAIGLNAEVARQVHQTRLVRLAREGTRYSPQFLQRLRGYAEIRPKIGNSESGGGG
jgi:hypothetical protein